METRTIIQAGTTVSACFFFLMLVGTASSQITPQPQGATQADSAFQSRGVVRTNTLPVPFASLGRLEFGDAHVSYEMTKHDRRNIQYRSLPDALIRNSGFLPMSQGGFGQFNSVSMYGSNVTNQSVSTDGRSVFDPWNGTFNMELIAPEGLERVEILTGTNAIGMAMQSMRYNTATPYTAFWYAQGGGDFIAADVALAQNVSSKTNVSLGVRRTGADGRYLNTQFDIWNVRATVRVMFTPRTHGLISYQLSSANSGMWGGLKTIPPLELSSESTAAPVFSGLRDLTRRHDLTANLVHLITADSSNVLSAVAYGTVDNMLRIRDSTLRIGPTDSVLNVTLNGVHTGVLVRYDIVSSGFSVKLGGGVDYSTVNATAYTAQSDNFQPQVFALVSNQLTTDILITAAARAQVHWDRLLVGAGLRGSMMISRQSSIAVDLSFAQRAPSAADGLSLIPEGHLLGLLEIKTRTDSWNLAANVFHRQISNTIQHNSNRDAEQNISLTMATNGGSSSVSGTNVMCTWQNNFLEVGANIRATYSTTEGRADHQFPLFLADASAAYVYRVGSSTIKLGIRGVVVSPMSSLQFVPLTWSYIQPVQSQNWANSGLDGFLMAIVGNAAVKVSYENVLAQRWYTTAISPEIVRDLRLSVTWSFFD
jgi:hypothetical protein